MREGLQRVSTPWPKRTRLEELALGETARELLARSLERLRNPWSRGEGRFPDFLGIGAQKAGTTWLFENLRRHPQLFLPARKELHFFDLHFRRGMRHYRSCFSQAGARTCGEITPAYGFLSPRRIRLIRAANPDLKLILLLRDPVQRAWSGAVMELADRCGQAAGSVSESSYESFLLSNASIDRTLYTQMIDRWSAVFPAEQLFVGFFEDIERRPWKLFQDILTHLGVDAQVERSDYPIQRVIIPTLVGGQGERSFARLQDKPRRREAIPARLRALLEELYREEIGELRRRYGSRCDDWSSVTAS